jgi:hypothetical protein
MNRILSALATLALLCGFAGTARADDLILYSQNYQLN